jgi:hypothetical protein
MRKLIIRDHRGHVELDLDTEEAIRELEQLMNNGMLAVATKNGHSEQVNSPTDAAISLADEVRMMWPLRGGVSP